MMVLFITEPPINRFAAGRRKSVFAEQYDPEEDEEEENNKVIFPKTDEQRSRLCDSVKNILLFRALDPEQVRILNWRYRSVITIFIAGIRLQWKFIWLHI